MSQMVPFNEDRGQIPVTSEPRLSRRAASRLAAVEADTLLRFARVIGEGRIQSEKLYEADQLVGDAMVGHARLHNKASCLSRNDPLLSDELRYYTDMAKLGKGEILADTFHTFRRI